ncbi:RNA polymerase factor sigma-54 [Sessilibacter corallicola]|uniref:RNA polymerase sigma-54 factor n=1 Tax=Sessilibacter corallicola TaxID=2904075 RepID=A0ABQ0A3T2_9GAMM
MKQSLQLKMGQQLTMTPQLQQAIRLLQLSTLDLQQEIQEALESNPMLEVTEVEDTPSEKESASDNTPSETASATEQQPQEKEFEAADAETSAAEGEWQENIPEDLPVDTQWDDIYQSSAPPSSSSSTPAERDDSYFDSQIDNSETLQEHLLWQLNLTPMSDHDRTIAHAIIDSVEPSGLLSSTIEDIYEGLKNDGAPRILADEDTENGESESETTPETAEDTAQSDSSEPEASDDESLSDEELSIEEVLAVQHRLQLFDPIGSCSVDLSECLQVQLNQYPLDTPGLESSKVIVKDFLGPLGNRDYKQIMRRCRLKEPELKIAIELIQQLTPHPGALIGSSDTSYIVPDVFVSKKSDRWVVELNPDIAPRLKINNSYASLVKRADSSDDNTFLRDNLQEARWFLKSLQSRNETLLKVASCIVDKQQGFLDHGPEAMRPLVLHDIAEDVGMHESTISRVTTQKYMHTPQGIFELKYFFSSHVSTDNGGECSSTAIRAIIKKLVAAEDQRKPLSDSKITALLADQGIKVARRTIAKYRESLGIPASNERKRLI